MAEAMALGKTVVATGYSGNLQFMTPENSLLVDYDLVGVRHEDGEANPGFHHHRSSGHALGRTSLRLSRRRSEKSARPGHAGLSRSPGRRGDREPRSPRRSLWLLPRERLGEIRATLSSV
jgi:hypothetical protein